MFRFQSITSCALLLIAWLVLSAPRANGQNAGTAASQEKPLIAILQSDAPKSEKALACKKLAVWGSVDAVPALAELLPDPELTSWARIALEAIPDPAADAALREALDRVEGRTLIGVINSIGVRRDGKAVEKLAQLMQHDDAAIASASAAALGNIGGTDVAQLLREALPNARDEIRSAVAEGCILCAEQLLEDGQTDLAVSLYDAVRGAAVPRQRAIEATRGAILARKEDGVPLLLEQLRSHDPHFVNIGLATARELPGADVTKSLVNALDDVPATQQPRYILALTDRGDKAILPAMIEAVQSDHAEVRLAAMDALRHLGDASCVGVLLNAAAAGTGDVAEAATTALQSLPGADVDSALISQLEDADGKQRVVLLQLIGRRRIDAAPALLASLDDEDGEIRAAALHALGEVITLKDLPVLVQRATAPRYPEDAEAARKALQAACVRMPDREACAKQLADALKDAPLAAKITILETLAAMGGPTAVQTVGLVAKEGQTELQDAATRLLGGWMSVDAAPVLLDLARQPGPFQIRSLRGYLRLARQFQMSDDQRVAMCRAAWELADRPAERDLVLEIVERYPSVGMLRLAVEIAKDPAMKNKATAVAMAVAQKVSGNSDVRDLLEQIDREPVKIDIIKAEYGAGTTWKDVTSILRRHVRDLPLVVLPSPNYNSALGGDPVPGVVKQLKVQYRMDGKAGEAVFNENAPIVLPMPE